MSLLDTLKSLLGLGPSREESPRGGDVGVTVEREPEESGEPEPPTSPAASEQPEPSAQSEHEVKGTDAAEGTPEEAAEPTGETAEETTGSTGDGADEPTTEIKGVGPAYGDRLAEAGVDTVADLAAADPEELAAETDLSEKRVRRWVERARAR